MKLAYFGFPHAGGTFSVFRHLRAGLSEEGIDVRWLGLGDEALRAASDPALAGWRAAGMAMANAADEAGAARSLVEHVVAGGYDGVFVNVLADPVQMNAVRYLPAHIRRIMIVHNISRGTYAAARTLRDHVHASVAVSPRIHDDLVGRFGFAASRTVTIMNATDLASAPPLLRPPMEGGLRLLYLGRVEDQAKGVFWLPRILRRLPEDVTLTVAGDGPDLPRLRTLCEGELARRVTFMGVVAPQDVQKIVGRHDVLIAPSRFEGFGIVLAEAMALGCVPVVSLIRGVTDAVVDHGRTGLLFPVGDTNAAAREVAWLMTHPAIHAAMGRAAAETVRKTFTVERMTGAYAQLLRDVGTDWGTVAPPLGATTWSMAAGLQPGLRSRVPVPVKNLLRTLTQRFAI